MEPKELVQLKAEFEGWLSEPMTQRFMSMLGAKRQALLEEFAEGRLQEDTEYKTQMALAKSLGNLQVIGRILNREFLEEDMSDD